MASTNASTDFKPGERIRIVVSIGDRTADGKVDVGLDVAANVMGTPYMVFALSPKNIPLDDVFKSIESLTISAVPTLSAPAAQLIPLVGKLVRFFL